MVVDQWMFLVLEMEGEDSLVMFRSAGQNTLLLLWTPRAASGLYERRVCQVPRL